MSSGDFQQLFLIFWPILVPGAIGVLATSLFWWPLARRLGVMPFNNVAARKVIFAGVKGGSPELQKQVKNCRFVFAGVYLLILFCIASFAAIEGALLLCMCFFAGYFIARPFELMEDGA